MKINPVLNRARVFSIVGLTALVSACGGGGGGDSVSQGALRVQMTDAPACGFDAVNVTVSKVRVHKRADAAENEGEWQEIVVNPAKKINLLDLTNGVLETLGQTSLPTGSYTQVRLLLAANAGAGAPANSVVATGSTAEIALDTPSAVQSGVKINTQFDVAADVTTDLVLDFDACKSIVTRGNGSFGLKPVITAIPKATSGGISGYITTGLTKAVVSAQQNGVVIKSTVPDPATGAFTLSPMPPSGTASYVVVLTADGRTTAAITGVPVTTGSTTSLSTNTAPITLPASAMQTVSGNVTPVAAQGMVRATQTFATTGPKVEVAFKAADLNNGAYSLSLPVAAPLRGQFGTLPITLTADSTLAGKYGLEATATGYKPLEAAIDISTTATTKDFALVQ